MSLSRNLHILIVDDEEIVHQTIGDYLRDSGHTVDEAMSGGQGFQKLEKTEYDLILVDFKMQDMDGIQFLSKTKHLRPTTPAVMVTAHGSMEVVIEVLRLGALDFLVKPIKFLELDAVLEKAHNVRALLLKNRQLSAVIGNIQTSGRTQISSQGYVGESPSSLQVRNEIQQIVEMDGRNILITGDTGTGKEVVAREIHHQTGSDEAPFIAVSCPALSDTLIESELFGHVKGSFTGATQDRSGYFELADSGTLFLDEVADLSPSAQAVLLRVLETRQFRRVGGSKEIKVKVRVIAATNAPLEKYVEKRRFRRDLYYRLNVHTIKLALLHDRIQDIMALAEHFLSLHTSERNIKPSGFSKAATEKLLAYHYPGNARELRNIIERAINLSREGQIEAHHLNLPEFEGDESAEEQKEKEPEAERLQLIKALEQAKWNRSQAARNLGITYSAIRHKMRKYNIQ